MGCRSGELFGQERRRNRGEVGKKDSKRRELSFEMFGKELKARAKL